MKTYGGQTFHLDNGIVDDISKGLIYLHHGKFIIKQNEAAGAFESFPPSTLTLDDQLEGRLMSLSLAQPHHPTSTHETMLPKIYSTSNNQTSTASPSADDNSHDHLYKNFH